MQQQSLCTFGNQFIRYTESVHENKPNVLIIDSIQTMFSDALDTPPGSIGQVKECTMTLMQLAKGEGVTVFVIGHVNKEGSIAGPKVLEHMVDCVLYFEGDQHMSYRILRAAKTVLVPPTKSAFLKWRIKGWPKWLIRRKRCFPAALRMLREPASPVLWRAHGLFWQRFRL